MTVNERVYRYGGYISIPCYINPNYISDIHDILDNDYRVIVMKDGRQICVNDSYKVLMEKINHDN